MTPVAIAANRRGLLHVAAVTLCAALPYSRLN